MILSVIVPIYNAGTLVVDSLGSAFAGLPSGVEFVLVDDGSTDDSMLLAERAVADAGLRGQVKVVRHRVNKGVLEARKSGISASSGDYITFMDADDRVRPGCYARITEALEESPVDLLSIGYVTICDGKEYSGRFIRGNMQDRCQRVRDAIVLRTDPYLWTKVIRSSLLKELVDPASDIAEDWAYTVQLMMKVDASAMIDDILYEYHVNPDSILHAQSSEDTIIKKAISEKMNVVFIEDMLRDTGQLGLFKKEIEARKYNVKRMLLPVSSSHRRLWMSTFSEMNFRILFNPYVPISYKMKHVMALAGVYSWSYPFLKRLIGR